MWTMLWNLMWKAIFYIGGIALVIVGMILVLKGFVMIGILVAVVGGCAIKIILDLENE